MDLSIVVVNWNTRDLLARCLRSVLGTAAGLEYSILVVDNASEDGSVAMVRERFPQVQVLAQEENLGFGRAVNLGARHTTGDYLLVLNADCILEADTIPALVRFMRTHEQAGAAGPRLLDSSGHFQPSAHPFPTPWRECWRLLHLDGLLPLSRYPGRRWMESGPQAVDVIQGACLILRRAALPDGRVFDEDYFMYSEEVDLCYRLRRDGWAVYWLPEATAIHLGGQSTRQVAETMFLQLYRSKALFFRKHYGETAVRRFQALLWAASVARIAAAQALCTIQPNRRKAWKQLAQRYRTLIRELPRF